LELIVRHCDDGQDQVDKVEGAEKNVGHEENDVPRTGRAESDLIQILPEVLSHQTKGTEVGLREGVKACVAVVGVRPEPLDAGGAQGTLAGPRRVSTHDILIGIRADVPGTII